MASVTKDLDRALPPIRSAIEFMHVKNDTDVTIARTNPRVCGIPQLKRNYA